MLAVRMLMEETKGNTMTDDKIYIPPAWPSTIEQAIEAAIKTSADLDGRNHLYKSAAGKRYRRREELREAALQESIAVHGVR